MDQKGTFTLSWFVLFFFFISLAVASPTEEDVEPETPKSDLQSTEGESKSFFTTSNDGRNFVFAIPGLGLGVTIGWPDFTTLTGVTGATTGLGGAFSGIGLGLFGLLLTLGVAAAITLAIVLPISIGVGIYKKLVGEDETGFSGSYGSSGYASSGGYGGGGYAAAPAPSYTSFTPQSSYSIHRTLEEAARKYEGDEEKA